MLNDGVCSLLNQAGDKMKKAISILIIASLSLFGVRAYAEKITVIPSETTIVSESVSEETTVLETEIVTESAAAETLESIVTEVPIETKVTETTESVSTEKSDSYTSESEATEAETTVTEETSVSEEISDTSETEETEETEEELTEEPEAVVSVELPVESTGESVFDFIIDPQQLITLTNAAAYNGASFEPGATLYFKNTDSWYNYSSRSDYLTFTNLGSTYVNVSLSAQIVSDGTVSLAYTKYFGLGNSDMLYLALLDSNGNEIPLNEYGYAEINTEVPNGQYGMEYSFGLTGAANPYADWTSFSGDISIRVVWEITSLAKWDELQLEEQLTGENAENADNILNEILETTPVEEQQEESAEQEIVEETTEVSVNDGVTEESKRTSATDVNEISAEMFETDISAEQTDVATDTTV